MQNYYYNQLNNREKQAYGQMYSALMTCSPSAHFSDVDERTCDLAKVFQYIGREHPEMYFVNFVHYQCVHGGRDYIVNFSYSHDVREISRITGIITQKYKEILSHFRGSNASAYEKEKFLYDYLTKHIQYDYASLNSREGSPEFFNSHSIVGPFLYGRAVCDGISKTFQFLARKMGLDTILVTGDVHHPSNSGPHAWNIVQLDGTCYHIDVTCDLACTSQTPMSLYKYFNIPDAQIQKDHLWDASVVPRCTSDAHNYYVLNRLDCRSAGELTQTIRRMMAVQDEFVLKYTGTQNEVMRAVSGVAASSGCYRGYGVAELPGLNIFVVTLKR